MQMGLLRAVTIALILSGMMFNPAAAWSDEADKLTYLDSADPFYPSRTFPRLTTPQWIGQRGVDVVIVLAIDDLGFSRRHNAAHYELYLRPILDRLKKIDGRAPVSIITNRLNPDEPQLQTWLKEGVSLECHSFDHPCPILSDGDFALAQRRYNECLEQLSTVPGNSPVAFRVPCCDGMNNPSPRFYAEIFANGQDNGVRLLDLDNDGFLDVVIGNEHVRQSRVWNPERLAWDVAEFPTPLVEIDARGQRRDAGVRFGRWDADGKVGALVRNENASGVWQFDGKTWIENSTGLEGLSLAAQPIWTRRGGQDRGVRLRDVDHDGRCELLVSNPEQQAIFGWSVREKSWRQLPFALPDGVRLVDEQGRDAGLRFVDLNDDDRADLVFSNEKGYAVHVFDSAQTGWRHVRSGRRGEPNALPMIVRDGTNNGVWFHSGAMYGQNEHVSGGYFSRHMFAELTADEK